jgi:hypothetical protein
MCFALHMCFGLLAPAAATRTLSAMISKDQVLRGAFALAFLTLAAQQAQAASSANQSVRSSPVVVCRRAIFAHVRAAARPSRHILAPWNSRL